jgi:phthalate 4,5-dioxygenase oxygenase subunit
MERAVLSREENDLLTRVGPGTPMGETMRRFWMPALLSSELAAGAAPRRVRLLGEDLIASRDASGRAVVGTYPVRELGETVWAYLGPPAHQPALPEFEFTMLPSEHVHRMKAALHCNWAQVVEGVIDSAHSNYLHSNGIRPGAAAGSTMGADLNVTRPSNDGKPKLEVEDTPYGFRYAAIRKPLVDPETRAFVRVTLWMAPFWGMVPSAVGWGNLQAMVPVDDEHTMFYHYKYCRAEPISAADRTRHEAYSGMVLGVDIDPETWRPRQTRENNWLQDREAMRNGSWSGLGGVAVEDFAVEESMGPIFDRTKEHLGTSDAAVIRMRRLMIESARALVAQGTPPHGLRERVDYRRLVAEEAMVPIGSPWQESFATV